MHRLVARWAAECPDVPALIGAGGVVTYRELDTWAGRVSGALGALGVAGGALVGVCVPRSPELIVALLGVLKAGGAYVVMDPDDPGARIAELLADAGCAVTVVVEETADLVTGPVVDVCGEHGEPAEPSVVEDAQAACVFYTSGSRGRPKGVVVTHGNLAAFTNQALWDEAEPRVGVLLSALGFDALTFDLWPALTRGGRVVVPAGDRLDVHMLAALLAEHGVTDLFLTSSWFTRVAGDAPTCLRGLRPVVRSCRRGPWRRCSRRALAWW